MLCGLTTSGHLRKVSGAALRGGPLIFIAQTI